METKPKIDLTKLDLHRFKIILVTENGNQLARIVPRFEKPEFEPIFPYSTD